MGGFLNRTLWGFICFMCGCTITAISIPLAALGAFDVAELVLIIGLVLWLISAILENWREVIIPVVLRRT